MNLNTPYYGLALGDWERLAYTACYELNQEIKSQAERAFYNLTEAPNLQVIMSLISNGSETLVFVLFNYLGKYPQKFCRFFDHVINILSCIASWQFVAFTFVRGNAPPFQKYVTRTIMTSLGMFLKILYEDQATTGALCLYLANLNSNFFKLYLFKAFIDAVEVVDYEMGYIKYRIMVYNFQDYVIPMICDTLMPYFYNIEEWAQINQLSQLTVNQTQKTQQASITSDQQLQSDYVLMLLEKIVQFNYNITYSEYESDTPIDSCLITFPDKVSQKIHNKQFLNALFYIIQKISSAKKGERGQKYLQTSLKCVQKLVQSKLTFMDSSIKDSYFLQVLKGLTHFLKKCVQIGSEALLQGIIICNKKLFLNCDLTYLKSICYKQHNTLEPYNNYIKDLLNMVDYIVSRCSIRTDSHLLQQSLELTYKFYSIYGYKNEEIIEEETLFIKEIAQKIISSFVNNLATNNSIFPENKIVSISESKSMLTLLFQYIKKIGSIYYGFFFQRILQKYYSFINQGQNFMIPFSNMVFLISQIIDYHYLQRNIYVNPAQDKQYCVLGDIVSKTFEIINLYFTHRHGQLGSIYNYTDTAIIIFMQAICLDFLANFDCRTRFKINQNLFIFMTYGPYHNEYVVAEDDQSEETMIRYLTIFTKYLNITGRFAEFQPHVDYVLNSLEKIVFKLKWNMNRSIFLKTNIYRFLSSFFEGFIYDGTYGPNIRTRVAKILVTLTFDDILDQYKFKINKFVIILSEQPLELMLYDLIGLFEGIQTHTVSKYFYRSLKKTINLNFVFENLYKRARDLNQEKGYADYCRLMKAILNNKGFRISNSVIAYDVFELTLPYLNSLLNCINTVDYVNNININLWESSICELIEIFREMLSSTNINIYMLEQYTLQPGNQVSKIKHFAISLMRTMVKSSQNLDNFPEMEAIMMGVCNEINKSLLQYIFYDPTQQLVGVYAHLHIKMIDRTIALIKLILNGNKGLEEKITKCFDCLRLFYTFFNKKCKIQHKRYLRDNLEAHYKATSHSNNNKNIELVQFLINFTLANQKSSLSFIKCITRLLYELNLLFSDKIFEILSNLSLPLNKLLEIQRILNFKQKEDEESFGQQMKAWIREMSDI